MFPYCRRALSDCNSGSGWFVVDMVGLFVEDKWVVGELSDNIGGFWMTFVDVCEVWVVGLKVHGKLVSWMVEGGIGWVGNGEFWWVKDVDEGLVDNGGLVWVDDGEMGWVKDGGMGWVEVKSFSRMAG